MTPPASILQHMSALTSEEADLYQSFTEGEFGQGVRLEQERVRFSLLEARLAALPGTPLR